MSDLFGHAGRELLDRLAVPDPWRRTVDASLALIDDLELQIANLTCELKRLGADHRYVRLLIVARASYADFEDLWSPLTTGVAPSGAFCTSLDDERRAALHGAYRTRLGVGEGPFELTARAWGRGRNRPSMSPGHRRELLNRM